MGGVWGGITEKIKIDYMWEVGCGSKNGQWHPRHFVWFSSSMAEMDSISRKMYEHI